MVRYQKQAVGHRSKSERVKERKRIGKLGNNMVKEPTLVRYQKALVNFLTWVFQQCVSVPKEMWDMDPVLGEYIEHLWEEGDGISFGNDTLAGLLHYRPKLKDFLPYSRKLLKTWNKKELPARAAPFSIQQLFLLVKAFLDASEPEFAIVTLLMFFLILRTGEANYIKRGDITFSPDYNSFILNLGQTKVGSRRGNDESVACEIPWLSHVVASWAKGKLPGDPLCSRGIHRFRKSFSEKLRLLPIDASLPWKPYSLRRGGATWFFRKCASLSKTVIYGRWNSPRTCRIYINEALAVLATYGSLDADSISQVKATLKLLRAPLELLQH